MIKGEHQIRSDTDRRKGGEVVAFTMIGLTREDIENGIVGVPVYVLPGDTGRGIVNVDNRKFPNRRRR